MIDWQWPEIDALENDGKWIEAKSLMMNQWNQNPYDLKTTIRLGFFCWYFLTEEEPLEVEDLNVEELATLLNQITDFGLTNFMTNEEFLWCFGYMISLFPYYFGEYACWQAKGDSMLKSAVELSPREQVYTYTYLAAHSNPDGKLVKEEFRKLQVIVEDRFRGEGLLSVYFKDVWSC
ncbi:hypothetical protein QT711_07945 [Sporosarcina saromensis]|uniref:DUF4240 domain-containing protein n=1 Tax=Sporosarcina saromensis TaxID=359365 RepID=A0ABU4G808_9BACL|nr:hypothetical protein [Sporosarcina saromensis]MDW0113115.1 hypothetical protein [Sporosarcina saromensis]